MDPSQSAYSLRHSTYGRPREAHSSSLPPRHYPPSSIPASHAQQPHFDPIASSRRESGSHFSRPAPPSAAPAYPYSHDNNLHSHTQHQYQHQHQHHYHPQQQKHAPRPGPDAPTREHTVGKLEAEEPKGLPNGVSVRREEFAPLWPVPETAATSMCIAYQARP
ncbi:hypothetical protein GTR04_6576 [Trichophyton interdigitale]|uniref:Uncharacterized protein n=1 Tax=Trichophyton interdigitale (strain MR816) TaxID=1215338 RepID=A0A059J7U8_TRIIM|nr:hypothetical protein GY631_6533 [Trichophyton interdigitale]KAG5217569.1 hypothetical protein GY632_6426 [Trichophyton interdigitale]KAG8206047.1 hypothetical protein GTR04_6576 [Trichophyton interdigitale]KDB23920.1 hypothetical protein H109_04162 [Trichophyton interdigitale MR816]